MKTKQKKVQTQGEINAAVDAVFSAHKLIEDMSAESEPYQKRLLERAAQALATAIELIEKAGDL